MDAVKTKGSRASKRKAVADEPTLDCGDLSGDDQRALKGKQAQSTSSLPMRLRDKLDDQVDGDVGSKPISHVCKMVLKHVLDMEQSDQGYPIVLRARNLEASLELPRRRIYDVFHIIQAIGLLSNGSEEYPSIRGHQYIGEHRVVETISNLRASVMSLKRVERRSKSTKMAAFTPPTPAALSAETNEQSSRTKIPALWQVTHKLLRWIFARGNSISIRDIYTLDDEKDGSSSKSRRYYDVLAVLTTCNVLQLNTTSKFDRAKSVKLNPLILTDPQSFSVFGQVRHDIPTSILPVSIPRRFKATKSTSDKKAHLCAKQKAPQRPLSIIANSSAPREDNQNDDDHTSFATLVGKTLLDAEPHEFNFSTPSSALVVCDDQPTSPANKTGLKVILSPYQGMYELDEFESFFSLFPLTDCDSLDMDDFGHV